MFSHPKFLWFAVIFFTLSHVVFYMYDGVYHADYFTDNPPSSMSVVKFILMDYDWIGGLLGIFMWIFHALEAVVIALIAIEGLSRILGAIRR